MSEASLFRDSFRDRPVTERVTKRRKRGRPPVYRTAMTAAERQARRREKLRKAAQQAAAEAGAYRAYQPPHGYGKAKATLQAHGHHFERARREFGFEEGVFVDGAFLGTDEVIALAKLPKAEREQRLAEHRLARKDDACGAVASYMAALRVSFDEFIRYVYSEPSR
jgi:hypothetical protein